MSSNSPGISEKITKCASTKCHRLNGVICSALDIPLEMVSDCSHWQGREGFIEINGQKVITDPYGYLANYPDSIISFRENGIYISKSITELMEYCKNNFPPMCWKNYKKYNEHLYQSEEYMKEAFENSDVYISPHKVVFYDEGSFIRLDNITIETFVEQYLHFINHDIGRV